MIGAYSSPYREPKCYRMSWCLEARWDEDGATCFYHPRTIASATACGERIRYRAEAAYQDLATMVKKERGTTHFEERPLPRPFNATVLALCRKPDFVLSTRSALNLKHAYWDPLPCQGAPLFTNYDPDCGIGDQQAAGPMPPAIPTPPSAASAPAY
jgi:hypothetical protein